MNSLLFQKRFAPFFWTQFFGAFNDNLFKNALVVLLTFHLQEWTTWSIGEVASLAPAIFLLPFFLCSALAGQMADKFPRDRMARWIKGFELLIVTVLAFGFYFHLFYILLFSLFLFGIHSAFFGPVKYAILPQHLSEDVLVAGNALIESGTFIAILLGTLLGSLLAGQAQGPLWISLACMIIAFLGFLSSQWIPSAPAADPSLTLRWNFLIETWRSFVLARQQREVFFSIVFISWFWLFGLVYLAQFPVYAQSILHSNESTVAYLLGLFTVGIALGSWACEKLSHRVSSSMSLVFWGALGLSLFTFDFSWASQALHSSSFFEAHSHVHSREDLSFDFMDLYFHEPFRMIRIVFDLMAVGFMGGLYCVPLYTTMQSKSDPCVRARVIASNNILNSFFMVAGSLLMSLLLNPPPFLFVHGLSLLGLFQVFSALNLGVVAFLWKLRLSKPTFNA